MRTEPFVTIADFDKQPRGPYHFDRWLLSTKVETPIGDFDVELREPPDDAQIQVATQFVLVALGRSDEILDKIYEHYERLAKNREWLRQCGVPTQLTPRGVLRYVRSLSIVVIREYESGGLIGSLFVDPLWDVEHKIDLVLEGDKLVFEHW